MTTYYNTPSEPSVTLVTGTKGFPEISFFKTNLLLPKIANSNHTDRFKDINLFNSVKEKGENYEHLLNLTDGYMNASLFNMLNIYELLDLAENTPDIIEDPS